MVYLCRCNSLSWWPVYVVYCIYVDVIVCHGGQCMQSIYVDVIVFHGGQCMWCIYVDVIVCHGGLCMWCIVFM